MKRLLKFTVIIGVVLIGTILCLIGLSQLIRHRQESLLAAPPPHGTLFLLAYDPAEIESRPDAVERLKEVMRKRFSRIGVRIFWQSVSPSQVRITAPIEKQRDALLAKDYISHGGLLEFRLVYSDTGERLRAIDAGTEVIPPEYRIETYKIDQGPNKNPIEDRLLMEKKAVLGGGSVTQSNAYHGKDGWSVQLKFDGEGGKKFGHITEANIGHRFAIVLDGVIQSAPAIRTGIYSGDAIITGRFSEQEARGLANILDCPLPIPIKVIEAKTF